MASQLATPQETLRIRLVLWLRYTGGQRGGNYVENSSLRHLYAPMCVSLVTRNVVRVEGVRRRVKNER